MHRDTQQQQLSPAFKEILLFGGRLLSSQEGMRPREPEIILSFLRASVQRADSSSDNAAKRMSPEPHSVAPAGPVPAPSSAAPGAATATNKGRVLGWRELLEPGEDRQVWFYYLCIKSALWLDQQHKAEEGL